MPLLQVSELSATSTPSSSFRSVKLHKLHKLLLVRLIDGQLILSFSLEEDNVAVAPRRSYRTRSSVRALLLCVIAIL